MAQQLVNLDARGVVHTRSVLAKYLPGLDPGVTPLSERRALLPATTLRALRLEYGRAPAENVLREAGVVGHRTLIDREALDQVLDRDVGALPPRPAQPADTRQWHLNEVEVRSAWNYWGGPSAIDWGAVKVGQVDTGYTRHKVLGFPDNSWLDTRAAETFFAPSGGGGGAGPGKGVDPLEDQRDGHGTRIASVICGHDLSAPGGPYYGIAPKVPLVPVRIANHVLISHAQRELAMALRYLVREIGVGVINLSMGFLPRLVLRGLKRAIDETYEAGVIFVCAAGQPLPPVISPAHGRRSIAAAGSTLGSIPWGGSAHGTAVDWAAPADAIYRAEPSRDGGARYAGGGDGTSYSAGITSGAAALWLARHGAALPATYPEAWQVVEAFKVLAKRTSRPMPHQRPGSFGAGIVNIADLLNQQLPAAATLRREDRA